MCKSGCRHEYKEFLFSSITIRLNIEVSEKMATIKDVARYAQVSTSTVSHVLNKTRYVSDDIIFRVMQGVEKLNYAPSALARSLKLKNTRTVGMLVTTSTNPFFAEVVKGVERRCYEEGYSLLLCNTEGDSKRLCFDIDMLLQKKVDGLLLMSGDISCQNIDIFAKHAIIPTVVLDLGEPNFPCDKIQDNSFLGGYLATQYFIQRGHTEIACITGFLNKQASKMRLLGYKKALQEAGLSLKEQWIVSADFECVGGTIAFDKIYKSGSLPSAIFVCNDMMAMGVISAVNKKGLRVPEDISIIGYDNIQLAKFIIPPLTTVQQAKFSLGCQAFNTLLDKIKTQRSTDVEIELTPNLIVRESVKDMR